MLERALLFVTLVACSKNQLGEACNDDGDCVTGYICFRGSCSTAKDRDRTLNAQSGVGSNVVLERPAAGGDRVKVRVTHGEGSIFAACLPTERLVGGGCKGGADCDSEHDCHYLRSYPGQFTDDDTLGARWICNGAAGTMQAYALCQGTAPSSETAPAAGVGSSER